MADEGIEGLNPSQREALKVGAALLGNKEIRRDVQRLYKRANPNVVIPELEAEEALAKAREEDAARFDKQEKEIMTLRVNQRVADRKEQCAKEGVDYDDVCKVVVDEKCAFETGIKILKLQQQTAEPSAGDVRNGAGAPTDILPGAEFRKAGGNVSALRRVSAQVASDMINGFRGRKVTPRA
jgi:hypothetical protein